MIEEERKYPFINIQVVAEGMAIQVVLAPGLTFVQTLNEQTMSDIVKKWKEVQKEKQTILQVARTMPTNLTDMRRK